MWCGVAWRGPLATGQRAVSLVALDWCLLHEMSGTPIIIIIIIIIIVRRSASDPRPQTLWADSSAGRKDCTIGCGKKERTRPMCAQGPDVPERQLLDEALQYGWR